MRAGNTRTHPAPPERLPSRRDRRLRSPHVMTESRVLSLNLDNLPASLVVRSGDQWEERWVGLDGDALTLVSSPARPEVSGWADRFGGTVPEGGMVEVQLAAGEWLRGAMAAIGRGSIVVIEREVSSA